MRGFSALLGQVGQHVGNTWRAGDGPPVGYAVIDLETTGLHPNYHHRIVEIAVVDVDLKGQVEKEWSTLINPERDIGPTHIHGIHAEDVAAAPRFEDVIGPMIGLVAGRILVAHNLAFDLNFLTAELQRLGVDLGVTGGVCTLALASRFGIIGARDLGACCKTFGIEHATPHHALSDAEATASLLRAYLHLAGRNGLADAEYVRALPWPTLPAPRVQPLPRGAPPVGPRTTLASLVASLPPGPELNVVDEGAALDYLAVLDRALEDRTLADDELVALSTLARQWGLDQKDIRAIHWSYLEGVRRSAWADGRLTDEERRDILRVADLLAVEPCVAEAAASPLPPHEPQLISAGAHVGPTGGPLAGMTVCFTGESVCSIDGRPLTRHDQLTLATRAGATAVDALTKKVNLLVLADPASASTKAKKATQYGVRRIAEPVFWRMAGVTID